MVIVIGPQYHRDISGVDRRTAKPREVPALYLFTSPVSLKWDIGYRKGDSGSFSSY